MKWAILILPSIKVYDLTSSWQLPGNYVYDFRMFWQLPDSYLTITWQLNDSRNLSTTRQLPDNWMIQSIGQLADNYQTITWQLIDYRNLTTCSQLKDFQEIWQLAYSCKKIVRFQRDPDNYQPDNSGSQVSLTTDNHRKIVWFQREPENYLTTLGLRRAWQLMITGKLIDSRGLPDNYLTTEGLKRAGVSKLRHPLIGLISWYVVPSQCSPHIMFF